MPNERRHALSIVAVGLGMAIALQASCSRRGTDVVTAPSDPPSVAAPIPQSSPGSTEPARVVAADFPTALAQAGDGRLFIAERGGRIRILDKGSLTTFAQIDVSQSGERGLLGIALDPEYPAAPYVYAFASPKSDESISRVLKITDSGGRAGDSATLLTLPAGNGCCHKGGRLRFGPDKMLYVTLGENQTPRAAAVTTDVRGKILRYTRDGNPAPDNPFGDTNPVWAFGLRNPFGIGFAPDGSLYATDNGPSGGDGPRCCDSAKKIERGGDYGWPDAYGDRGKPRGIAPIWTSGDAVVVPTGAAVISTDRLPQFKGAFVFCTYANKRMFVLTQSGASWAQGLDQPGQGPRGCALDVIQGTDGYVYFSDDTTVYRIG